MKPEYTNDPDNIEAFTITMTINIRIHDSHPESRRAIVADFGKVIERYIHETPAWKYTLDVERTRTTVDSQE